MDRCIFEHSGRLSDRCAGYMVFGVQVHRRLKRTGAGYAGSVPDYLSSFSFLLARRFFLEVTNFALVTIPCC